MSLKLKIIFILALLLLSTCQIGIAKTSLDKPAINHSTADNNIELNLSPDINSVSFNTTSANVNDTVKVLVDWTSSTTPFPHEAVIYNSFHTSLTPHITLNYNSTSLKYEGIFTVNKYWTSKVYVGELIMTFNYFNDTDYISPVLSCNGVTPDTQAPTINTVSFSSTLVNVSAGASSVNLNLNITDDKSGTYRASYYLYDNNNMSYYYDTKYTTNNPIVFNVPIDQYHYAGKVYLKQITLCDKIGNCANYINGTDFPNTEFIVTNLLVVTAPTFQDVRFIDNIDAFTPVVLTSIYQGQYSIFWLEIKFSAIPTPIKFIYTEVSINGHINYITMQYINSNIFGWGVTSYSSWGNARVDVLSIQIEYESLDTMTFTNANVPMPTLIIQTADRQGKEITSSLTAPQEVYTNNTFNASLMINVPFTVVRDFKFHMEIILNSQDLFNVDGVIPKASLNVQYNISLKLPKSGYYTLKLTFYDDVGQVYKKSDGIFVDPPISTNVPGSKNTTNKSSTPFYISYLAFFALGILYDRKRKL